jgi:hypothetical protein
MLPSSPCSTPRQTQTEPLPTARVVERSPQRLRPLGDSAVAWPVFGNVPRELGALRAGSSDSEPVPIGVFQIALTSGETLFVDGNPELLRDRVDVVDVQVN